jgi:hypothetical protein
MSRRHLLVARDQLLCDMRGSDGAARDYATHTRDGQSLACPKLSGTRRGIAQDLVSARARQTATDCQLPTTAFPKEGRGADA